MKLKDYTSKKGRGSAKKLAEKLGISTSYLSQMAAGTASISPERSIAIETATGGEVTRIDLRPEDWMRIWPDYLPPDQQNTAAGV
ncbi:TPA: transcriptional regulator [Serratia fonticola]|uniref:transcriptional regulator n=1 Tax=Serratia fonticola TaxID=47917 RepID=UPI0034C5C33B